MHSILISLASNHEQEKNLSEVRKALAQVLVSTVYSPAIWTEPFNMNFTPHTPPPSMYLNQLVSAQTSLDADELILRMKDMELVQGRDEEARRQHIVPIDLDLLQYDTQRFHLRDWQRPYVRQLLDTLFADNS